MDMPQLSELEAAELRGARFLRGADAYQEAYARLEEHHRVDRITASERLHRLKEAGGLRPADNVVFGRTGDLYDELSGDFLGSLTDPNS